MGPMPQYAALVDGHGGSCEGSLVRGNDQPSPEGGPCRPPLGGYRNSLPLPPRGRGRRPKAGRGRGAALHFVRILTTSLKPNPTNEDPVVVFNIFIAE